MEQKGIRICISPLIYLGKLERDLAYGNLGVHPNPE